ncbi:G-patch domain-containing protein [Histoplasma capsulatum var. duboisii H88]|uniref:G-patch domain-containing protein n=1 Tax=Ajellomyces capsulatus (strain H88) TaxID=544711 RepID=F0UN72_AJEC8|nr:G-patch domain-containing protein [Histoplasma capsulatum var. duboisii H88]QSS53709.1 G-patch domain-containing protein [Histoplasma capsulatum var. duboisii H88]
MAYDDDEYFVSLEGQRVFGAGIKRKRVHFIPSSETSASAISSSPQETSSFSTPNTFSIGDRYLSIVLSSSSDAGKSKLHQTTSTTTSISTKPTCEICDLPLPPFPSPSLDSSSSSSQMAKYTSNPHEATLAHQICLSHSHPPSAIDRTRTGFKYLSAQGWDPDSRLGLGPQGQGIAVPLKPRVKHDTLGLGVKQPEKAKQARTRVEKLNAKQVRKMEVEGKKKGEKLREMFYASYDIEKYLGS